MNPQDEKYAQALQRILNIMNELREQCPWDKKQTLTSLRHLTIEETYELSDAILEGDLEEIKKELGDLFLHIVFYAKIASEKNAFDMADIINGVCEKVIARHPHIYGNVAVDNEEDVKRNWEILKLKEKGNQSVLSGVPNSLPALVKAMRIQEKARGVGFDWQDKQAVWEKVVEELHEFQACFTNGQIQDEEKAENEFGDLLFSLVNYARFIDLNPETALEKTNKKFMSRFNYIEEKAKQQNKALHEMTLAEMDQYWEEAKHLLKTR